MALLPSQILPETNALGRVQQDGSVRIEHNWYLLFYNLWLNVLGANEALAPVNITVGASPFIYTATSNGNVLVKGGTVTLLALGRGAFSSNLPKRNGMFPLSKGDQITVTYAHGTGIGVNNPIPPVAPTMQFWPQ